MNHNDRQIEMDERLQPLVDELESNAKLYTTAAGNALNDQLRQLFEARAQQRETFAKTLRERTWANKSEDAPDAEGNGPLDVLQRGSMTIKATMTIEPDKTDHVLVEETREANQALLEKYRDLLDDDFAPPLLSTLERQYALIEAAQANLATMLGTPGQQMALALFPTVDDAERAVRRLQEFGVDRQHINVLAREEAVKSLMEDPRPDTTRESATAGAVGGGALGGFVGFIAGASTALVMGLGTILTAGALPVVLGVTAAGAGIGASYGGLLGALMGWGISEGDVQHFIEGVRDGSILVAVQTERQNSDELTQLMRDAGATYASAHQDVETEEPAGSAPGS